jgi:hypothetical protein
MKVAGYLGAREHGTDAAGLIERAVKRKYKVWRIAQGHFPGEASSQKSRAAFKPGNDFGCVAAGERHYERRRVAQIGADPNFGNGYAGILEQRITTFTVAEDLRQRVPQLLPNPKPTLTRPTLGPDFTRNLPPIA